MKNKPIASNLLSFQFPKLTSSFSLTMVARSKPTIEQFLVESRKPINPLISLMIPLVDLTKPESKHNLDKACREFGFFKVVSHGVPIELIKKLEAETINFFSSALCVKEKFGPPDPFGYGNKSIGRNGDLGWVEYLLLNARPGSEPHRVLSENPENFMGAVNDYLTSVKNMACHILELLADELKLEPRNVFSKLLMDEESDSIFRLNYYPPYPQLQESDINGRDLIGFGEHTDPQIISVLRSNDTSGLEILLRDGNWMSVPPDSSSFFINVGDSLQVMTNGRFKSVKHRVVANREKSRMSMIYFGGPPLSEKIAPLASLMEEEEDSLYKEFTWSEYKKSALQSRLCEDRLGVFEKSTAC